MADVMVNFYQAKITVKISKNTKIRNFRFIGLIGLNGSGKSSMLAAIANKEIPIPDHVDIFHLSREIPATNKTALEAVLEVDEEIVRLEHEAERISCNDDTESQERLNDIYERLDALNSDTREVKAASLLHGLGFTADMQRKKCKGKSKLRILLKKRNSTIWNPLG